MGSPYPWHYTLRWPYYFFRPSTKQHTQPASRPLSCNLLPQQTETCRLMFFGDLMCMKKDRVPAVDPALRALLGQADLVVGNCEAPVTLKSSRPEASYFIVFKMAEDFIRAFLAELGVEPQKCLLSVANNHIGDQGVDGFQSTLGHLRNIGITPIGDIRPGDEPVTKHDINGLSLGFAAWTHWLNCEVFTGSPGVWRTNDIENAPWSEIKKSEGIDCLIGTPHWEYEFQHYPRPGTRSLARRLITGGFDLLVGHHPHVAQPIEWFDHGVCLYSIGNLNGPAVPYVSWPMRSVSIFDVRVVTSGPERGRIADYTLHTFAQIQTHQGIALVPLAAAPAALRTKLAHRLGQVYPGADPLSGDSK